MTLRQSGTSATEATIQAGGRERPSTPPHERIGRYVVLDEVGAGAMGRVLRAYDPRLRREVALKLVRAALDETSHEAVMHEAQAMAQLSHPNIVAVYDADVVDGEPFLAMEYVEGGTLADWIAEGPRPWPEVLEVFTQAGHGLAAAHAAGIVHRDFKPGNVMRRSDGRVQVTDFGIAMEADTGDVRTAGTPGYMAPEQHAGNAADARSDQYAFCVSVWEALAGQRPFAGENLVEDKRALRLRAAAEIRALPKPTRDALQRGLSPDPAERHESIGALLSALAFTPGRTRSAVLGIGTLAAAGMCLVGWQWHRDARAREQCDAEARTVPALWDDAARASVREAFVGSGVANGDAVFDRAAPWLDTYAQTWAETRRERCLTEAKGPLPLSEASAACFEEHRLRFTELIGALSKADGGVVNRSVKAVAGLRSAVECNDEQSLRVRAPLPADDERREQLATLQAQRARVHASLAAGRAPDIAQSVEDLLDQARAIDWAPALVDALLDTAEVREAMSDFQGAREAAEEAFARALAEDYDVAALSASARLVYVVGYGMSKHDEGLQWSRTGDAIARRLGFEEDHPRRLALLNNTGVLHWARGDYDSAKVAHEQAIAIKRTLLGPEHPGVASSLDNYGITLATMGDLDGARVAFESSLELTVAAVGEDHPSVADAVTRLGTIASEQGETKLAREYLERSLALTEAAVGPEHSDVALVLINLASTLVDDGAPEEALARAERAMALVSGQGTHPYRPSAAFVIGQAQSRLGRHRQALESFEEAATLRRATLPESHPDRIGAEIALAQARLIRAKNVEASVAQSLVETALAELPEHERTKAIRAEIDAWRASGGR